MLRSLALHLFPLLLTSEVRAEYRAFLLEINNGQGVSRQVISTLDDIQYPAYHPLQAGEELTLVDTWMCWERSDHFSPVCARPPRPTAEPVETSTDEKARNPAQSEQIPETPVN